MFVALLAACGGGEGRCEQPPCEIPPHRCSADADCFQTEFCDYAGNTCGAAPFDQGVCASDMHESCDFEQLELVCGCDGMTYESVCGAAQAGTDVDVNGGCASPPGTFWCAGRGCQRDSQVCFEVVQAPEDNVVRCLDLPAACRENPTCACLLDLGCFECTEENGEFRVKCELPEA